MVNQHIPMNPDLRQTALQNLSQTKKFYESASSSSEAALESINASLHPQVANLNRKMMTFFSEGISNFFDVSEKLTHAKTVDEVFQIQAKFFASQQQSFQRHVTDIANAASVAQTANSSSGIKSR